MVSYFLMEEKANTSSEILGRRALQVQRGTARAAVMGVNDGLVSTLCLILGVVGAGADNHNVLVAGFAGLLAGAISMAAGEWISVRSQVELFGGILKDIRAMVADNRNILMTQLATRLVRDGHGKETAVRAAREIADSDRNLVNTYARQVMGFNPDELGSPWRAALSSFILFIAGALVPLAPWFFSGGLSALYWSIGLTAVSGLLVGGYIGFSSGKNMFLIALRQLLIIILASAVTYGIGYLFGVNTA